MIDIDIDKIMLCHVRTQLFVLHSIQSRKCWTFCLMIMFMLCVLFCRGALEIIKAHDGILKQKKAYRDVFLPDAIMLRDRQV